MKERFIEFLKRNNIYDAYVSNLHEHHHQTIDGMTENPCIIWISGAFDWDKTEEGFYFWERMSKNWIIEINKQEESL